MRILMIFCLALLPGIHVACGGGGGGPGRDICSWGYEWDPYTQQYIEYEHCYDAYKPSQYEALPEGTIVVFESDDGDTQFWDPYYEGLHVGLMEFQADMKERGYHPLPPQP